VRVKAASDDSRRGKMLARQRTVRLGPDPQTSLTCCSRVEPLQFALQRRLAASGDDIVDVVVFQIAKCGRATAAASEEVLVNAQNLPTLARRPLGRLQFQIGEKPSLEGVARQLLPLRQAAAN
jgi:hypothetical protein